MILDLDPTEAPARLRNYASVGKKHSLASTRFLEHIKIISQMFAKSQPLHRVMFFSAGWRFFA